MPLSLRRATPADAAAIRALVREAYVKCVAIIGREPLPMTADYDRATREHMIDLLIEDDRLVALIELAIEPDCVLIENVAVRPGHAGRGYGRFLLAHAAEVARSLDRARMRLYTNVRMVENIALYRRVGYAVDREEITPDGRHVVHMSMAL